MEIKNTKAWELHEAVDGICNDKYLSTLATETLAETKTHLEQIEELKRENRILRLKIVKLSA